jgi:hypothetical protein
MQVHLKPKYTRNSEITDLTIVIVPDPEKPWEEKNIKEFLEKVKAKDSIMVISPFGASWLDSDATYIRIEGKIIIER